MKKKNKKKKENEEETFPISGKFIRGRKKTGVLNINSSLRNKKTSRKIRK